MDVREAVVTSAFSTSERAGAVAFLPDAEAPWTGLVATALVSGGLDIFNIDGLRIMSSSGPQLTTLAAVPSFPLRGESFPLLFGADMDGRLRAYAIVRAAEEVVELPLEGPGARGDVVAACYYDAGIGYFDLALLAEDDSARIVRVRDAGGDGLEVANLATLDLPFPARNCAGAEDGLLVSAPNTGIARISTAGETQAFEAGLRVDDVAYTELLGRPVAVTVASSSGRISVFDAATLEPLADLVLNDGLNAPGFQAPSSLAISEQNFGGMAFSTGVVAIYDRGDDRVKLVAREVISRAVIAPDS